MLDPVSHLEDCNQINYVIQLSIYAVLLLSMFPKHKIGKLTITFIKEKVLNSPKFGFEIKRIPVPFMKYEAIAILDAYNKKYPFEQQKEINLDPDDF